MSNGNKLPPKSYYTPDEVVSAANGKKTYFTKLQRTLSHMYRLHEESHDMARYMRTEKEAEILLSIVSHVKFEAAGVYRDCRAEKRERGLLGSVANITQYGKTLKQGYVTRKRNPCKSGDSSMTASASCCGGNKPANI